MSTATAQPVDRKAQLRAIADAYFAGLATKDVSHVPYAELVMFRTPLALGGSQSMILGRTAVLSFFSGIYDALGAVQVIEYFYNDDLSAICVKAEVGLKSGATLRVVDLFRINAAGEVIEQENHYDPRPAMG